MKNRTSFRHRETRTGLWRFIMHSTDIRRQLWITLGLVVLHRFLLNIPLPGFPTQLVPGHTVDNTIYTIIEFTDMLSAGGLLKTSILGLGLLPFKFSGQILELLFKLIPALEYRLQEEPREAKKLLKKWKVLLAIPFGLLESMMFLNLNISNCAGESLFTIGLHFELLERIMIVLLLTAGSFITYWICELISEYGFKKMGTQILVLSGIFSGIPRKLISLSTGAGGAKNLVIYLLELILSIVIVIYFQNATRKVEVRYARRVTGRKLTSSASNYIPLSIWYRGVDGFIGSQLLVAITTFYAPLAVCSSSLWLKEFANGAVSIFSKGSPYFGPITFFSVLLFACLSSNVNFEQTDFGKNMQIAGGVIPGVRPGSATTNYLQRINRRLSFTGGVVFGLLAILPWISNLAAGTDLSLLDGEKVLIIVTSLIDIYKMLQSQMLMRGYESRAFLR